MTDQQHVLYRMYDVHDLLLYVGITLDPAVRFRAHRGGKEWWPQVSMIKLEHFESRRELEAAELAAIDTEGPVFNIRNAGVIHEVRVRPSVRRRAEAIADKRGDNLSEVLRDGLKDYIRANAHLLEEEAGP